MGKYTSYGHSTWHWETFVQMDYAERNLWNGLYTTGEAKRFPPGLWHGDQAAMSRAAMMPVGDVFDALDRMEAKGIVEIDRRYWVVRMTALPNAGERPASWKALLSFWERFCLVPPCPIRDRYPLLMKWLVEQVPNKSKGLSADMLDTWNDTFGSIRIPSEASSSYVLCDSDTGTHTQPSLFSNDRADSRLLPSGTSKEISPVRPIPNRLGTGEEEGEDLDQAEDQEEAKHEVGRLELKLGSSTTSSAAGSPPLLLLSGGRDGVPQARVPLDPGNQAAERSRTLREAIGQVAGSNPVLGAKLRFLTDDRKPEPS